MRIYTSEILALNNLVTLIDSPFQHIVKVMRKSEGDEIELFNGLGGAYLSKITKIEKKSVTLEPYEFLEDNKTSKLSIHLIQGFSKGDRMDFAIQKAVELGVDKITPLFCDYSQFHLDAEKQQKKINHWSEIIFSACEQCGLNIPPILTEFDHTKSLNSLESDRTYLVFSPYTSQTIYEFVQKNQKLTKIGIIIGPEGGFSPLEIEKFISIPTIDEVQMGHRILRTETAAIAAISSLHALIGDFC